MRLLLTVAAVALLATPVSAVAQDAGMMAAQQAQMATDQANQQAQLAAQQANNAAMQAAQQAAQDSTPNNYGGCCAGITAPPKFSVAGGTFTSRTTVKISDASRGAIIYYTTDGWTPTPASPRYRGPITIGADSTLQAVAISPYYARSLVSAAKFEIVGTPASSAQLAPANSNQPVTVPLEFNADVSSQSAAVGDKIPLTLAQDIHFGDITVKRGAIATVTITAVDKKAAGGVPGVLTFEADALQTAGGPIPLFGTATREGTAKPPNAAVLIPVVGPFTIFKHGAPALITKGTPFTAYIDQSTLNAKAQP